MKIAIASDHAGYELKAKIIKYYNDKGYFFVDYGTKSLDSVDYPDYGYRLGQAIIGDSSFDFGIAICGTGIGISIAANKVKGVRAALIFDLNTARMAKEHNNANIIAFGARRESLESAIKMIDEFISAQFESRHQVRVDKLNRL